MAERLICCPATRVLDTVLDPERYAIADHKIGSVLSMARCGDAGVITARGRIGFVQTPPLTLHYVRVGALGIQLTSIPTRLGRFRAAFECRETDQGTWTRHVEELELPWLATRRGHRILTRFFTRSVEREMDRLKQLMESRQ